jgi:hypothetical protein
MDANDAHDLITRAVVVLWSVEHGLRYAVLPLMNTLRRMWELWLHPEPILNPVLEAE